MPAKKQARYGDIQIGQRYWLEDGEGPYNRILTDEELALEESWPELLEEAVLVEA